MSVAPPPEGTPWTVLHLARWSAGYLAGKGVAEARLDAEHLLADALGLDRLGLYLEHDRPVTPDELASYKARLLERAGRKPLQYILGRAAFRELELAVDGRVLVPRPETEELVEVVLTRVRAWRREGLAALDVGTGSGAIALSLAREGPFQKVVATDASAEALQVAGENAGRMGIGIELREGRALEPVLEGERFDVVVSNPPYVAEDEHARLEPEVKDWEPREALVASGNGLDVLFELAEGAERVLSPGGLLALETGAGQARLVADRIRAVPNLGPPEILRDLQGRERMVVSVRRDGRGRDPRRGDENGEQGER